MCESSHQKFYPLISKPKSKSSFQLVALECSSSAPCLSQYAVLCVFEEHPKIGNRSSVWLRAFTACNTARRGRLGLAERKVFCCEECNARCSVVAIKRGRMHAACIIHCVQRNRHGSRIQKRPKQAKCSSSETQRDTGVWTRTYKLNYVHVNGAELTRFY